MTNRHVTNQLPLILIPIGVTVVLISILSLIRPAQAQTPRPFTAYQSGTFCVFVIGAGSGAVAMEVWPLRAEDVCR